MVPDGICFAPPPVVPKVSYAPFCFLGACHFRRVKPLNKGHVLSPELKANAQGEALFASTPALARSKRFKRAGRRLATSKQRQDASADPTLILTRKFMRMSKAHDRIRMQVLAASLVRGK